MYNFALAFVICAVVYIIGEYVAKITKAWIPSVFVSAADRILDSHPERSSERLHAHTFRKHHRYLSFNYSHGYRYKP